MKRSFSVGQSLSSIIGFSAAISLGVREDTGLIIAGSVGTLMIVLRDRRWGTSRR